MEAKKRWRFKKSYVEFYGLNRRLANSAQPTTNNNKFNEFEKKIVLIISEWYIVNVC